MSDDSVHLIIERHHRLTSRSKLDLAAAHQADTQVNKSNI